MSSMSMIKSPAQSAASTNLYATEASEAGARSFTLRRVGRRPLRFQGWQLVEATGYTPAAPVWYDINVFETRAGSIVVELLVHREAMSEPDLSHVEIFKTIAEAAAWLEQYTPAADMAVGGTVAQNNTPLAFAVLQAVQLRQRLARVDDVFRSLLSEVFQGLDLAEDPEVVAAPARELALHDAD
jgi:hypothetical protein